MRDVKVQLWGELVRRVPRPPSRRVRGVGLGDGEGDGEGGEEGDEEGGDILGVCGMCVGCEGSERM